MNMGNVVSEQNFYGMHAEFREPNVNHKASEFMAENWDMICRQVCKMGVDKDKVNDLVTDVWISIHTSELEGNGYDVSYSDEGDIITVKSFVFGRIKGYSMNSKYHSNYVERRKSSDSTKNIEIISASCSDSSDLDKLDGFQKAYAMACTYDDIENIDAEMSLRSNINLCMKYDEEIGFSIINLFRHIELVAGVSINMSIFDNLRSVMNRHADFSTALREILETAVISKPVFEEVVASF